MSRRPDGNRRYTRSKGGLPPVLFTILSVSQTAGKAGGGSVITVFANGINGTPTSTLGAVSNVTGTSFQITTSAGSGAVLWTATNGNGQVSSSQPFTYLAAPVISSLVPNNGPQTLTTSGVVVTCSGLPPSGSGVTTTVTFDGNAASAVVIGSTSLTCTVPTDTTSGAKNVVVMVDGVASTGGTGAWTYNPPPAIANVETVGVNGGTSTCNGSSFVSLPTASVKINGVATPLTVTYESATQIILVLSSSGAPYTAGSWDLTVTNPDGQAVVAPGAFQIVTQQTLATIYGANLVAEYNPANATVLAGLVTALPDSTGNGNNCTVASALAPSFNAASPNFAMGPPSITFARASSQYLACPSLGLGAGGTMYFLAAVNMLTGGGGSFIQAIASYSESNKIDIVSGIANFAGANANAQTISTAAPSLLNVPATIIGGSHNVSGTSTPTVTVNNGAEVDGSAQSYSVSNSLQLTIAADYNGSTYADFAGLELAYLAIVSTKPTAAQMLATCTLFNELLGVTQPPLVTASSIVPAGVASAPLRLSGSGFMVTTTVGTVQLLVSGSPVALTVTASSSTVLDCATPSLAPGTYDVIVTNPDGRARTFINAVTAATAGTGSTTAIAAWIMNNFGLSVTGLFHGQVALNGSNVSSWLDMSGMGNHMAQATAANQPAWLAADATNMNGQPSVTPNGSTDYLFNAAFAFDGATPAVASIVITNQKTSVTNEMVAMYGLSGGAYVPRVNGKTPQVYYNGTSKNWTGTISGLQSILTTIPATANPTLGVSVANGAEQTVTSTLGAPFAPATMYFFSAYGSSQFSAQPVGLVLFFNAIPGSTALANFETFAQGVWGIT